MRTQRERTIRHMNMHICASYECDEEGWPIVEPSHAIPERLVTFQVGGNADREGFCHFFIDDYRFERLWNKPERYVDTLKLYQGVIAPDFSMYMDMPYPMQIWNHYRSLTLMMYWQDMGMEVIPTLNWSDEKSLEFCAKGLKGGTFAVTTVGAMKTEESADQFVRMLSKVCEIVQPDTLLMYGKQVELGIDPSTSVRWYANDNHERVVRNAGHREKTRLS